MRHTDTEKRIVANLQDRIYGVNLAVALSGVEDWTVGLESVRKLLDDGIILKQTVKADNGQELPLYSYNRARQYAAKYHRERLKAVD